MTTISTRHGRDRLAPLAAALCAAAGIAVSAPAHAAPANLTILQYFESEWDDIERRVPDLFLAGYGGVWLPPPSKTAAFQSPGYDPFDRFDLGKPPLLNFSPNRSRTSYGTENTFRAMIDELHQANVLVYIDGIFNHNSGRTTSDFFLSQGGWPGFHIPRESPPRDKQPTDNWGDFHAGVSGGYLQSENPGGPRYDLYNGDLVALIDIAQESNNQFIRHPVADGNPQNIPAGTIWNRPDPANARLYPDRQLAPETFTNPGTARTPGTFNFTRYPYNTANPSAGDAVTDNTTGLLMRYAQWMMQEFKIDGFRLDALKHTPPWFWDIYFDAAVYQTRTTPFGQKVTPFTFGENTVSHSDNLANYMRKDGFANRDALDLSGAGNLRNLLNGGGFGSWADILGNGDSGFLDVADDGLVNGSVGVYHMFSHDNGTLGNGSSSPAIPNLRQQGLPMQASILMHPGRSIVYYNARGLPRTGGFFPREGTPIALGLEPISNQPLPAMVNLVHARNQVGYGEYFQLNANIADVLVFERRQGGFANSITAVNDRYDAGTISVTFNTSYPQGTRLHELTGNAADPVVDPTNAIPDTVTVGAGGSVTLTVPNNRTGSNEHGRGFLVYAEALPAVTLSIEGQNGVIPADPSTFPAFFRRLNDIPVVTADSFTLRLDTTQTDPLDPNTDDNAIFRINQGNQDWNGNAVVDISPLTPVIGAYEQFVTERRPLFGSGQPTGLYRQTIDATRLGEGFHYISTITFRKRPAGSTPLFREVREVVYVDREPPAVEIVQAGQQFDDASPELSAIALDRTTTAVYYFFNLAPGTDPVPLINTSNAASRWDRSEWRFLPNTPLPDGTNRVTIVAVEHSGNTNVVDATITIGDPVVCPADINGDGLVDFGDVGAFVTAFSAQDPAADLNDDGVIDFGDVGTFVTAFSAGC